MQSEDKIFEDKNFNSQYNYAKKNLVDFYLATSSHKKLLILISLQNF